MLQKFLHLIMTAFVSQWIKIAVKKKKKHKRKQTHSATTSYGFINMTHFRQGCFFSSHFVRNVRRCKMEAIRFEFQKWDTTNSPIKYDRYPKPVYSMRESYLSWP